MIDGEVSTYKHKITTNEDGEISFNIPALGVGEHIFEIEEIESEEYETVGKIRIKVIINEDGTIKTIEQLSEEKEDIQIKIEDGKIAMYIKNTPKGRKQVIEIIKVDKFDEKKKIAGVKFDIAGKEYITDENGVATSTIIIPDDTREKDYLISEKTTPDDYLANKGDINLNIKYAEDDIIVDANLTKGEEYSRIELVEEDKVTIIVTNEPIVKYSIEFSKGDFTDSSKILEGAIYNIKVEAEDGYKHEVDVTTLKDLSKTISDIQGYGDIKLTITEKQPPEGYKLGEPIIVHLNRDIETKKITKVSQSSNMIDINIEDNTIYLIAKNVPKGSYITINKVDKKNETIVLPKVEFTINGMKTITNEEGKIQGYQEAKEGETSKICTIIEKKTLDGYEICPEIQLKVDYDKDGNVIHAEIIKGQEYARVSSFDKDNVNLIITNEKIETYGIEIEKHDKTDNSIKIKDTKFKVEITNSEGTKTEEIITDAKGIAKLINLIGYGEIKIKVTEIETPSTYALDTEEKTIILTRDRTTKEIVVKDQTGKNITVTVDTEKKIVKITFANEPIKLGADILKVDSEDETITLKDVKFNVKIADKEKQIVTKETGVANIDLKDLERNKTYELELTELETVKGYKLNNKPIKLTIDIDDSGKIKATKIIQGGEFAKVTLEDNRLKIVITNEKIPEGTYIIELEKQSNLDKTIKLAKAKYKVWIIQEDKVIKETEVITNKLGTIQIDDITFDKETTIKLKEIEAPTGYYLDEEEKEFTIKLDDSKKLNISDIKGENIKVKVDEDNQKVLVSLVDEAKGIKFEIEKVDKDNEKIKLSEVGFKYESTEGKTDENGLLTFDVGKILVNTKKVYTIEETYVSEDYTKLDTPTQIEVEYDNKGNIIKVEILNNKEYVEYVGLKNGTIKLRFKNERVKDDPYRVLLIKKDKNNHELLLEGAKYKVNIESSDGNKNQLEVKTSDKGAALVNDIYGYGDITIDLEELEAPPNYKIDSGKKTIKVTRDKIKQQLELKDVEGEKVEAKVNNEDNIVVITVYDETITFDMDILKLDKNDETIKLSGVEFEIGGATYTTDEEGRFTATLNVPEAPKEYQLKIKETKTLENYKLIKDLILTVKIDANGNVESCSAKEGQENVKVNLEAGRIKLVIYNEEDKQTVEELKEYKIFIDKVDSQELNKKLSNARFKVTLTKDKNEVINQEFTTDKDGNISLGKLTQDGTYTLKLKEILAPKGYILNSDDNIIEFIAKDGKITVNKEVSSKDVITEVKDKVLRISLKNELKNIKLHIEKFVTKVDETKIKNTVPEVFIKDGKIEYNKNDTRAVHTRQNNVVIYNLRIYNEGNIGTYAKHLEDVIPDGLEFLPDHDINKKYHWKQTSDDIIETDILSKEVSEDNIIEKTSKDKVYYKEIQVAFKVNKQRADNEITNIAVVDKATDEDGEDKEVQEQDEAKIIIDYFDLSVEKVVNNIIVKKDGQQTKVIKGAGNDGITKAEITRKEYDNTTLQVEYLITVRNEGNIKGNLVRVIDYIPEGMLFDKNSNPNWKFEKGTAIYTKQYEIGVGQTKQFVIRLNWNPTLSNGLKENVVEILGEDEINLQNNRDTAKAIIMIATGNEQLMILLPFTILIIITYGVYSIKKYVL